MFYIVALTIVLYCLWALFEYLEGIFQGCYYDLYPSEKKHPNLHNLFTVMRIMVWLSLCYIYYLETTIGLCIVFSVSLAFAAPFFHNGALYSKRNDLNPSIYKKRWWANKEPKTAQQLLANDDADIEINVRFRIAMMVLSLVFFIGLMMDAYDLYTN